MNKWLIALLIIGSLIGAGLFYIVQQDRRAQREQKFREAVRCNLIETAKQFIKDGINVDAKNAKTGNTALSEAIHNGNFKMVELLLQHGAKIAGWLTPLEYAKTFYSDQPDYPKLVELIEKYHKEK